MNDKEEIIAGLLEIISKRNSGNVTNDPDNEWLWTERAVHSLMSTQSPKPHDPRSEEELPDHFHGWIDPLLMELDAQDTAISSEGISQTQKIDEGRPIHLIHPDLGAIAAESQMDPETLALQILSDEEVMYLFYLYHENISVTFAVLDPLLHTAANVKERCPLLFIVICTIASRYWAARPTLYTALMEHVQHEARKCQQLLWIAPFVPIPARPDAISGYILPPNDVLVWTGAFVQILRRDLDHVSHQLDAAAEVLQIANRTLPKYDFYRYSPDRHWSWPVHAASFLIKLVKPRCIELPGLTLTESQHTEILSLLDRFIHILRTSAIDDRHPPALYACSLADILSEEALDTRGMGCIENQQGLITDGSVPQIGLENFWDRML
ncbi:unnamed protein product [Rhizoctonia solani]|uniref:Uncharacterized protein n=1 Tax=Rhizoctonia solani TaxID=456999 RepID=A0A8H3ARM8_9AGAM|nr:unnamed protein product [Rhizoctonia solani]